MPSFDPFVRAEAPRHGVGTFVTTNHQVSHTWDPADTPKEMRCPRVSPLTGRISRTACRRRDLTTKDRQLMPPGSIHRRPWYGDVAQGRGEPDACCRVLGPLGEYVRGRVWSTSASPSPHRSPRPMGNRMAAVHSYM